MKRTLLIFTLLITLLSCRAQTPGLIGAFLTAKTGSSGLLIPNQYTLTVPTGGANVSIGVFKTDSTLIRTLVTTQHYNAGTYPITWNGKDDTGNTIPAGNYIVKVVSNNITASWQGVIGNTSDNQTGSTVHSMVSNLSDMVINGTKAIYVTDYSEGKPSICGFNTSTPQQKVSLYGPRVSTPDVTRVASDGNYNYYACFDAYGVNQTGTNYSFITATKVSDNSQVTFSSGQNYTLLQLAATYPVGGLVTNVNGLISNIAIQSGNNYLYACRPGMNAIYVYNKATLALVTTITTFTTPKAVAFDHAGHLWVSSGTNTIGKYMVNSDGTLTSAGVSITGVTDPGKIAEDSTSATVGVIDYSTQQLKLFSNSTGSAVRNIGQSGGYTTSSVVASDKFCFKTTAKGNLLAGFCFAPDGSLWIADTGNNRFQHFTASGTFIGTIQTLPNNYITNVDAGNTIRVVSNYQEFSVDYSQPLSGSTGWAYTNNWGATIPATYIPDNAMRFIKTFPNGRTYTMLSLYLNTGNSYGLPAGPYQELVELIANGIPRYTGKIYPLLDYVDDNNNLIYFTNRYPLTGYDSSNNPTWSSTSLPQPNTSGLTSTTDKQLLSSIGTNTRNMVTADGKLIFYNAGIAIAGNTDSGYLACNHLGAIKLTGSTWSWQTQKPTFPGYAGNYPAADYFDIGNGVHNNAGSIAHALGNYVITGYHGEFYKQGQTNLYNLYTSNGLALIQFGTLQSVYEQTEAKAGMAGNALTPQLVPSGNADSLYLYHGDESFHGGIHRWLIAGLKTLQQFSLNITYPSAALLPPVLPGIDLMAGLPFNTSLSTGTVGRWTVRADSVTRATVSVFSYLRDSVDIYLSYNSSDATYPSGFYAGQCSLGTNSGLTSWSVSGMLNYKAGGEQQGAMQQYLDVRDNAGKVITRLSNLDNAGAGQEVIYGNGQILINDTFANTHDIIYNYQPFEMKYAAGVLTISYAGQTVVVSKLEGSADVSSPALLMPTFQGGANPTGRAFDLKGVRFKNN